MTSLPASLVLAETSTPRYTSYPTAPHFHAGVDGGALARWLGELPESASLSLYLHVPYCRSICNYCGCNAKAALREEPLDAYAATLAQEIEIVAAATRARRVTTVHWGGGTPSLLGAARLKAIWQALAWRFDLSGLEEHAIELDPRTVDAELVEGLADVGITRASLGVQDVNAHVQKAMGRVQPPEIVERALALLRRVGVNAINLDLMYGLPEQSVDDVERTARFAASLAPARLAMFGYAHVPWFKVHQRLIDSAALPGSGERLAQAQAARNTLVPAGYEAIGLDHFARADDALAIAAREGRLRRNFQGYVVDEADALIGFGPSSIGRAPQGFAQNAVDVAGWRRLVEAGSLAAARGIEVDGEDRLRSEAIERLMCDFALDYGALAQRVAGDPAALDDAAARLDELAALGVVERDGRRVRVTPAGQPFTRLAAAAFDAYLPRGGARHSASV